MARTMLTDAIQHYLRAIYNLSNTGGKVSTTGLAREMRVSPASASAMVKKLALLPTRQEALGQFLGAINGVLSMFVLTLEGRKTQLEEGNSIPQASA